MEDIYLLTGSNKGDRLLLLKTARERLSESGSIVKASLIYETEPWGYSSEHNFLNQVLKYNSGFKPEQLMKILLNIEKDAGRVKRQDSYEDRLLDIDILFYGDRIIDSPFLKVPHPRIPERRFVLEPLAEIAAHVIHPVNGKSVKMLLDECKDKSIVRKYESPG